MKKLRGLIIMLLISLSLFGLTACQNGGNTPTYDQITAKEAKTIMDTESICQFGVIIRGENGAILGRK